MILQGHTSMYTGKGALTHNNPSTVQQHNHGRKKKRLNGFLHHTRQQKELMRSEEAMCVTTDSDRHSKYETTNNCNVPLLSIYVFNSPRNCCASTRDNVPRSAVYRRENIFLNQVRNYRQEEFEHSHGRQNFL